MGKIRIEDFFDPPPDWRQILCASPLIKVETFLPASGEGECGLIEGMGLAESSHAAMDLKHTPEMF
jgi:hypothetical protein